MMKASGFLPISTMSACLVMAQNGSNSGRSYQKTGACLRSQVHSAWG